MQNGVCWILIINRAEIKKPGTTRPDSFSIEQNKDVITAWPTKMALSPALADALLEMLDKQDTTKTADTSLPQWQQPEYAGFPWDEKNCWIDDGSNA